jgi:hypothetical protein
VTSRHEFRLLAESSTREVAVAPHLLGWRRLDGFRLGGCFAVEEVRLGNPSRGTCKTIHHGSISTSCSRWQRFPSNAGRRRPGILCHLPEARRGGCTVAGGPKFGVLSMVPSGVPVLPSGLRRMVALAGGRLRRMVALAGGRLRRMVAHDGGGQPRMVGSPRGSAYGRARRVSGGTFRHV